MLNLITVIF